MVVRDAGDPPKPIIFDWDDTICPSSFVDRFQIEVFEDLPVRVSTVQLFLLETARYSHRRRCCFTEADGVAWFL